MGEKKKGLQIVIRSFVVKKGPLQKNNRDSG
jgi:hypothetical protein